MAHESLWVVALYPGLLNLYADRGNLLVLADRCRRHGIELRLDAVGMGESLPSAPRLVYLGGGPDAAQLRCAADLARHHAQLADLAAAGTIVLGVCGGYQLLGSHFSTARAADVPGAGLLDVRTESPAGPRLTGHVIAEPGASWARGDRRLVGFENHQGRTQLGPAASPLGRVVVGHGNNDRGRAEGAQQGLVLGTYLHGPLFALNTWFADVIIERALGRPLAPLADPWGERAHRSALQRAERTSIT